MFCLVWVILEQFLSIKRSLICTFTRKLAIFTFRRTLLRQNFQVIDGAGGGRRGQEGAGGGRRGQEGAGGGRRGQEGAGGGRRGQEGAGGGRRGLNEMFYK